MTPDTAAVPPPGEVAVVGYTPTAPRRGDLIADGVYNVQDVVEEIPGRYNLFTYDTFVGTFTLPTIDPTGTWSIAKVAQDTVGKRIYVSFGLPGDTNGAVDGFVRDPEGGAPLRVSGADPDLLGVTPEDRIVRDRAAWRIREWPFAVLIYEPLHAYMETGLIRGLKRLHQVFEETRCSPQDLREDGGGDTARTRDAD